MLQYVPLKYFLLVSISQVPQSQLFPQDMFTSRFCHTTSMGQLHTLPFRFTQGPAQRGFTILAAHPLKTKASHLPQQEKRKLLAFTQAINCFNAEVSFSFMSFWPEQSYDPTWVQSRCRGMSRRKSSEQQKSVTSLSSRHVNTAF